MGAIPAGISRRRFLEGVGGVGSLALLAACGAGSSAPTSTKSAAAAPSLRGVTLRISTQAGPSTDAWKALIPSFESKYGATVAVDEEPDNQVEAKQFAENQAKSGAYDLLDFQYFDLGKYVVQGALLDLNDFLHNGNLVDPNYGMDDFIPNVLDAYGKYTFRGKAGLYALPHKFDIYLGMMRPDKLKAAGIPVPGSSFTYDDLVTTTQAFANKGEKPAIVLPLMSPGPAFTTWSAIFRSYGGDYFDKNQYPVFNNKAAQSAIGILKSLVPDATIDAAGLTFDPASRAIAKGEAALGENWASFLPVIVDPSQSSVSDKVQFMQTPSGPVRRAAELGGWATGISTYSKNKEGAFLLLQHLTSKANAVQYALAGGSSARKSVAQNPDVVKRIPYYPLMIDALKNAVARPTDPTWGETQTIIGTAVSKALTGDPAAEFLQAAQSVYDLAQRSGFTPQKTGPRPK